MHIETQSRERDAFPTANHRIDALSKLSEIKGFAYVATPYTKYKWGMAVAAKRAAAYTGELIHGGVCALSPIAHGHAIAEAAHIDPSDFSFWLKADSGLMRSAEALIVIMMDGWRESAGVQHEIAHFESAGKPIVYLEEFFFLDKDWRHKV